MSIASIPEEKMSLPQDPKNKGPLSGRRILVAIAWAVLWIALCLVTARRTQKGSNDFDTFYQAGKSVLDSRGIYYQGDYYQDTGKTAPFLYPPTAACFFSLFAILPMVPAGVLWNAMNLTFFIASVYLILQFSGQNLRTLRQHWSAMPSFEKIATAVIIPVLLLDNLIMAQVNVFIIFLVMACLVLWKRGKVFRAGLVLSFAVLMKITPVFFCIYFAIKRQWKLLAGVITGFLVFSFLLPTLVLGFENTRIYHRQWAGKSIKPVFITVLAKFQPDDGHPLKKTAATIRDNRLSGNLTEKNQSLEASLTRLLLKDRNGYAFSTAYPIYAAQRYKRLPVIAGGLSRDVLAFAIASVEAGIMFLLMLLWFRSKKPGDDDGRVAEVSMVFLAMTLFSPLARSHQFIFWLLPLLSLTWLMPRFDSDKPVFRWLTGAPYIFYALQAIPYGKPAGMGTWANLALLTAFIMLSSQGRGKASGPPLTK